jgi:hypothetical protein
MHSRMPSVLSTSPNFRPAYFEAFLELSATRGDYSAQDDVSVPRPPSSTEAQTTVHVLLDQKNLL